METQSSFDGGGRPPPLVPKPGEPAFDALPRTLQCRATAARSGLSLRNAARFYGVSKSTIGRARKAMRFTNDDNPAPAGLFATRGPGQQLFTPAEEAEMVAACKTWQARHLSLSTSVFRSLAYQLALKLHPDHTLTRHWEEKGEAGKSWWRRFRVRHTDLTQRLSDPLDHLRRGVKAEDISLLFQLIREAIQQHGGRFDADQVFNLDETSFVIAGGRVYVIVERGSGHAHCAGNANRETLTLLLCVCANGTHLPPLLIVKGKSGPGRHPAWLGELDAMLKGTALDGLYVAQQVNVTTALV